VEKVTHTKHLLEGAGLPWRVQGLTVLNWPVGYIRSSNLVLMYSWMWTMGAFREKMVSCSVNSSIVFSYTRK
jgi:hypothetical protein